MVDSSVILQNGITRVASGRAKWRALDFSTSNHQCITFEVVDATSWSGPARRSFYAWKAAKVKTWRSIETLGTGWTTLEGTPGGGAAAVDIVVKSIMDLITTAYGISMLNRATRGGKPLMYLWTVKITELQRECHKLSFKRPGGRTECCSAINKTKARGFKHLDDEGNGNPWGLGYKLIT